MSNFCPCGSRKTYHSCCQPYLLGTAHPPSPEHLMRSRYTAFSTGNIDYLIATHHPTKRQDDDRQNLAQTIAETEWLSLRVLNCDHSQEAAGIGTVEFVAFFKTQGQFSQLHERSEFVRQAGRWYYLQGKLLPALRTERNDPCWCGSGKKYKQCHGP